MANNGFDKIFFEVFHDKILDGSKILTIRAKPRVVGKVLDVYFGSRFSEEAKKVGKLEVEFCRKITFLDFKLIIFDKELNPIERDTLWKDDGFDSFEEFYNYHANSALLPVVKFVIGFKFTKDD